MPGDRVVDHDLQRAGGGGVRVAEARDVHPEHLELRGHVELGGGHAGAAAEQPVGHHLGHRVPRRDQPVGAPVQRGHLTDRPDVLVGRAARGRRPAPRRAPRPAARPPARARRPGGCRRRRRRRRRRARRRRTAVASSRAAVLARSRWTDTPHRTARSSDSTSRRSSAPPPSSTCTGISRGAISTTCGESPSSRSARAASRPSSPPPTTTAERLPGPGRATAARAAPVIASRSSSVR